MDPVAGNLVLFAPSDDPLPSTYHLYNIDSRVRKRIGLKWDSDYHFVFLKENILRS